MSSIEEAFDKKEGVFIPFTVCGYPDKSTSKHIIESMVENGADIVELGIPFSDPMADGPTVMEANSKALENDIKAEDVLEIASEFSETPIVILAYANTIRSYGYRDFLGDAEEAGINGLIIPDMPPEEYKRDMKDIETLIKQIFLVSQNTSRERAEKIGNLTEGFAYLVSVEGTTGTREGFEGQIEKILDRTENMEVPRCIGFGISDPEQARKSIEVGADGVIMGSAVLKSFNEEGLEGVEALVKKVSGQLEEENGI